MLMVPCTALIVYKYADYVEMAQRGTKATDYVIVYSIHDDERWRHATCYVN